jgi:Leucine-rich repeat (LRR) protein
MSPMPLLIDAPQLSVLEISCCYLPNDAFTSLIHVPNLTYLDLSNNILTECGPPEISNLMKLEILYLHVNRLTDIPDLSPLKSLWNLSVHNNNIDIECYRKIRGTYPIEILEIDKISHGFLRSLPSLSRLVIRRHDTQTIDNISCVFGFKYFCDLMVCKYFTVDRMLRAPKELPIDRSSHEYIFGRDMMK